MIGLSSDCSGRDLSCPFQNHTPDWSAAGNPAAPVGDLHFAAGGIPGFLLYTQLTMLFGGRCACCASRATKNHARPLSIQPLPTLLAALCRWPVDPAAAAPRLFGTDSRAFPDNRANLLAGTKLPSPGHCGNARRRKSQRRAAFLLHYAGDGGSDTLHPPTSPQEEIPEEDDPPVIGESQAVQSPAATVPEAQTGSESTGQGGDLLGSENNTAAATYVLNTNSMKFHHANCRYASRISPENYRNCSSREEAIAQGFIPCGVCNP